MTSQITPSFATWSAPATRTARSPDTPTALSAARNVKSFIAVTVTANASDAMAAYKPKTHGKSKIASRKGAEMPKFYFTYGTDGQPFVGGWTEVEAPDRRAACAAFRSYHPDKTEGLLNCSSVYMRPGSSRPRCIGTETLVSGAMSVLPCGVRTPITERSCHHD